MNRTSHPEHHIQDVMVVGEETTRRGPPNRMNDLPYRDWMKFQKSFFRNVSSQALVDECIGFFTKAVWPNELPSRSLVIGVDDFDATAIAQPRIVDSCTNCSTFDDIVRALEAYSTVAHAYDFVLVDLRRHISNTAHLHTFLTDFADRFYQLVMQLLAPSRYCSVLVGTTGPGGDGFPLAWSVGLACRRHLKLRDEKVALQNGQGGVFYCLFMQADSDGRPATMLGPADLCIGKPDCAIPAWLIPKPPPRKKNEILHPAKYPETLVSEFIELFTKRGDNVFDPMVGTGSTLIAAYDKHRNAYGLELSAEFVQIARQRISAYQAQPSLLDEMNIDASIMIVQGDATRLEEVAELHDHFFDYAITSPPYWSMLNNPGSEYQRSRREQQLKQVYSRDEQDLGNIQDYDEFLRLLQSVYTQVAAKLRSRGYLTVVVKNVKRDHIVYPLAWDLTRLLCAPDGAYEFIGATLWCQDDVGLKPFAIGIHWVSNTLHNYCLHFRKRQELAT